MTKTAPIASWPGLPSAAPADLQHPGRKGNRRPSNTPEASSGSTGSGPVVTNVLEPVMVPKIG